MRRVRRGFSVSATAVVACLLTLACGFNRPELDCEDAVANLARCCPGFSPIPGSCQSATTLGSDQTPFLTVDQSDCIRSKDCAALVSDEDCNHVESLMGQPTTPTGSAPRACE